MSNSNFNLPDARYIFAVNMNEKVGAGDHGGQDYAVKVKFKNLPDNIRNIEALFEDRQISLKDGAFSDSFDPISTHIYKIDIK